jgi:hypothetical protein
LKSGGLLLKTGFVASMTLDVVVKETIAVPFSGRILPRFAQGFGSKTFVVGWDSNTWPPVDLVVVVVSDCSASGCAANGIKTKRFQGVSYGGEVRVTAVQGGIAVLLHSGGQFVLHFMYDASVSKTLVLDMLPPFDNSEWFSAISTVKESTVVVVLDRMYVKCTPDGCEKQPRSLDAVWSGQGTLRTFSALCLTEESCVMDLYETATSQKQHKLVLVPMGTDATPTILLAGPAGSSPERFSYSPPVALSESHIFFSQPRWAPDSSGLIAGLHWPFSSTTDRTAQGFAVWEKAFTWTGRLLQPAWDASNGGHPCPPLSGDEICGGRPACEKVCDRVDDCSGFTMDANETCRIYQTCDELLAGPFNSALKDKVVPCTVKVEGAVLPAGVDASHLDSADLPTLLNTAYVQEAQNMYVAVTNETAIYFDSNQPCVGYVLGMNKRSPHTIFAITYSDAEGQVQTAFQGWFRSAKNVPAIQSLVMCDALTGPAVPGQSPLYNCADPLVKKICFRSCTPLTQGIVADTATSYHKLSSTADSPPATVDSLLTDDDTMLSAYVGSSVTCAAMKADVVNNPQFCADKIKKYLCPDSCKTPLSEVLSFESFSCLPYEDITDFTSLFRTFANGSDLAYQMPQAVDAEEYGTIGDGYRVAAYGYPQCMTAALGFSSQNLGSGNLLTTAEVYPAKAGLAPHLELRPECAKEALCPTLTTCVESFYVFERELEHMLAGASLTKDGSFFPAHFTGLDKPFTSANNPCRFTVPFVQCPVRMAALHSSNWVDNVISPFGLPAPDFTSSSASFTYAFPKHILTAQRATGFIRTALYNFGKEIFRPVPGATRLRFKKFAPAAETVVVSLSGAETWWTTFNFDKEYELPTGYTSWVSDVIRLEAFEYANGVSSALTSTDTITFEITAHGYSEIEVFRFAFDGTVTKVPGVAVAASAENPGWFSVTIPGNLANADFVAAADLDECMLPLEDLAFPCEAPQDGGRCVNALGSYHCECISGYKGQDGTLPGEPLALGVQCVVDQYVASPTAFLLYHEEDAEYGIEISELKLYDGSTLKPDGTSVCMGTCKDGSMSEDCAFGYKSDESTSSYAQKIGPWTYAKSISSSSFFPGFGPGKVFDNDKDSVFKSERLSLSRADGTGAWIYWEVEAGVNVECVEVVVYCTSDQPKKFVLHRGKVGEVQQSAAFGSRGLPFTPPGKPGFMTFVAKTFVPGEAKLDLAVPCGIKDAQYFGEKLLDYAGVLTVCECEQLCLEHVDEGCATYKWYSETNHCFLQKDIFEGTDPASEVLPDGALSKPRATLRSYYAEGRGWWKRPLAYGWPGWFTGSIGPVPLSFKTTPATIQLDTPFSLTVGGVGFPFDEEIKEDSGARQRIKVLPSSAVCGIALPPPEVTGVDCTNEHTCTPRPQNYTRTSATWTGLQLSASKAEMSYKVCYCGGECWAVENWKEVPGVLELEASAFSFELVGSATPSATDTALTLKVSRPPFSGVSDKDSWKLKLVDSRYDCAALGATSFCGGATDCGTPSLSYGPDEVTFSVSSDGLAAAGDYLVCISEGASFQPAPHASGRYLKLSGSGAAHPAGFFSDQRFSAKAGASVTLSVAGYGLDGSVEELTMGADCTGANILTKSSSSDSATVFSGSIPDDWDGLYKLCQNETGTFSEIGTLAVTTRPDVGVNYVVTPGESTSFEVTGHSLEYEKDRVMVIDCIGTCGVSGPAVGVKQPGMPVSPYMDRPSLPEADAYAEVKLHVGGWSTTDESMGKYCPGNLMPIEMGTLADKHRCYPKCYANTCSGDSCFCSGYEAGYDTAESSSLCLNVEQCTDLCAQTPGCTSIDMHKTKDRCFLNTGDCATLHTDPDYNVWYKVMDVNTRRTMDRGRALSAAQVRQLLAGEDPGISWDKLLRFDAVQFAAGGEFKLCFCDPSLLASGICSRPTDYKIEVGKVHATGLECLLTNPKMQRGTCVPQMYGGLRCYDGAAPVIEIPDGYVAIPDTTRSELSEKAQLLLGFCQFAPEEEAMQYPFCAQHRQFAAPVPGAPVANPGA